MTPLTHLAGRTLAVFGLGGSGIATARALRAGDARALVWDDGAARIRAAEAEGFEAVDLREADWSVLDALVLSPGVPLTHPEPHWAAAAALAAEVEVIGDVELFARERRAVAPDAPLVAITGTNGKSTTTALIAHVLAFAGRDVQVGGNLGTPILALAPPAAGRVHVIECSSFQIDLAPTLDPSVGVLLNVTSDHLDRHGTLEAYAGIKERLILRSKIAVVGADDDLTRAALERAQGRGGIAMAISGGPLASWQGGFGAQEGLLSRGDDVVADLTAIGSLRGAHNAQNAAAAFAACVSLGLSDEAIRTGLASFPGLAHRMEQVARVGRTLFINDSKATNADSAEKALGSFPDGVHWIAGGRAKEGGIAPLAPLFPRLARAYLVGEAARDFADILGPAGAPFTLSGTLDAAVAASAADAAASAHPAPVVLLSPACASYDQFPNFEVRGDAFRRLVLALPGAAPIQTLPHGG